MGMAAVGVVRAEGEHVSAALGTDLVLLQRIDSSTGQYSPRLITAQNFISSTPGGYTAGAVLFADSGGDIAQDATNLSFNDSTNVLTVGSDIATTGGNILVNTAGKGLQVKAGSNARIGSSTLVGGTVTVSNTSVTANTRIFITTRTLGTVATAKAMAVTAIVANTSFTITSADATDTSVVNWMLVESL